MFKFLKSIKSRLTMNKIQIVFKDSISHKNVYLYIDCYFDFWVAESPFNMRISLTEYHGFHYGTIDTDKILIKLNLDKILK